MVPVKVKTICFVVQLSVQYESFDFMFCKNEYMSECYLVTVNTYC